MFGAPQPGIEVRFHETSLGTQARAERSYRYQTTEAEYRRLIERWVTRGVAGAAVQEVVPQDGRTDGRFDLDVAFTAARFGQKVSDAMRAICPVLVSRRESLAFTEPERTLPIVLDSEREDESVRIELPASFAVEEFPDAAVIDTDFGTYRTSYAFRDGSLYFTRALEIRRSTVPASRYTEVRDFFKSVRRAETAMVLLRTAD